MSSPSPVVVLDIGASKIQCLVGESETTGDLKILGVGESICRGIRRSTVIDMPKVVESIRTAVGEAERAAGLRITGAYVGIAGSEVSAHTSRSVVAISGSSEPIDERDVQRALRKDLDSLEALLKFINIGFIPLLLAMGAIVAALVGRFRRKAAIARA